MKKVRVALESRGQAYEIMIGRGLLSKVGSEIRRSLQRKGHRAVIISNRRVFDRYGRPVLDSLLSNGFAVSHWLMGEGERFKSIRTFEKAISVLSGIGLERHDVVVALGGGVVGDLAGFAAAVYLRGIPFIQVPTTFLSQIDSSVGGKTGVNLATGKNLVGAFHQPRLVVIDTETLGTLPARELTAGWCEAVKNGATGSRQLFQQTTEFLANGLTKSGALQFGQLESVIKSQCAFKASIVAGDERESIDRRDHRSRRILNFGHTVGHALEAATGYRRFRHGEAVGHGMLVAGEISKNLGLFEASELELLRDAVRLCGPLPAAGDIDEQAIIEIASRDKKSIEGQVQWILLERIGRARIVDGGSVKPQLLRLALRAALKRQT